ncbi:hypothetical protein FPSE_09991 [Fusarium pseudograminearum CS3096]|uniref:Protein kinase domain-containing protein n=1 Tax=Fusarium pseudograminearum (strain CS3096) TaxID=1028729 RepID=K3V942_FUSPC|nr:hypothetical protein FPSE_09991 [Fusarium pseudograminearum CS3096]EKJ69834.1 hypothetical protein FPSE_09991 [Fusarium pseudograminearum CS3096]
MAGIQDNEIRGKLEDPIIRPSEDKAPKSPPTRDIDIDHSPDFVSLLSLLDQYFNNEYFPADGKTPRILASQYPALAMQGASLGHGRTYSVWRLPYKGSLYAVKRPRLSERSYNGALKLMLNELRVLTLPPLVSHPNIVGLVGVGWEYQPYFEANGASLPYLIVEYCEYGTLAELLARVDDLDLQVKQRLILDVSCGLSALHQVGIAHCDVRCENVLIAPHPQRRYVAKITDFGSATTDVGDLNDLDEAGAPPVSFPCCAPEAYDFVETCHLKLLDIYSFGIVALSTLLGVYNPFEKCFSALKTSSWEVSFDQDLTSYLMDDTVDIRERVLHVKKNSFTETVMLWVVRREIVAEGLHHDLLDKFIEATLNIDPQARDMATATELIQRLLSSDSPSSSIPPEEGKKSTSMAGETGKLYEKHVWQPHFLQMNTRFQSFPLVARKKFMLDLEERFHKFSSPVYLIMLAHYSLHGVGSGSALPQSSGLDFLGQEAAIFDDEENDPSLWFTVSRYFHALGSPLPEISPDAEILHLSLAANSGSVVAMEVLRRRSPQTYWDIKNSISWELRGLNKVFPRIACNIEPIQEFYDNVSWSDCDCDQKVELLKNLQKAWEDTDLFQQTKETMLHATAAHGCLDIVADLIKYELFQVEVRNVDGQTPLLQACLAGRYDMVQLLVDKGADMTIRDARNENCLHYTSSFPHAYVAKFVELALSKGVGVNDMCSSNPLAVQQSAERTYCPGTPLHRAIYANSLAAVSALLRHGADPNLGAPEWDRADIKPIAWIGASTIRSAITPLQLAAKLAYSDILDSMLEAAPTAATMHDADGGTLLCAVDEDAAYGYYLHGKKYPEAVASTVSVLKNRGAELSKALKTQVSHVSSIAFACYANRVDLLKALVVSSPKTELDVATKFSISPPRRMKPLHHALKHGNEKLVQAILDAGASCKEVEVDNDFEGTIFMALCVGMPNGVSLAALLADNGAAIDIGSPANLTPLFAAVIASQFELADFLISRGADICRRIDHCNLLWWMLERLDEPGERQLTYAMDRMGSGWDTFLTNNEVKSSVFMDVAYRTSKASNTIRWLMKYFLAKFANPAFRDYHTPQSLNALDIAISLSNFDACEVLVAAGALQDEKDWERTLQYAGECVFAPIPDTVKEAGMSAIRRLKDDRLMIVEILQSRGKLKREVFLGFYIDGKLLTPGLKLA